MFTNVEVIATQIVMIQYVDWPLSLCVTSQWQIYQNSWLSFRSKSRNFLCQKQSTVLFF